MSKSSYPKTDKRRKTAFRGRRAAAIALSLLFTLSGFPTGLFPARAEAGSSSRRASPIIEVRDPLPENYAWIGDYAYNVDTEEGTITLLRCAAEGDLTVYGCALIDGIPMQIVIGPRCFTECTGITSLRFLPGSGAEDEPEEAAGIRALTEGDMGRLFAGDTALTNLDISGLDFSLATDLSFLCDGCTALTELITGTITPAAGLAPQVSCEGMFRGCALLPEIDLTGMDASSVTNMACMFQGCSNANIYWSRDFHTENVTTMTHMFDGVSSAELSFDDSFRTDSCEDMSYMFAETSCPLTLTCFDTHSLRNMQGMFYNHRGDGTIDLSGPCFYTTQIKDMSYVFSVAYGTPDLLFNDKVWTTKNVTDFSYMFQNYGLREDGKATEDLPAAPIFSCIDTTSAKVLHGMFAGSGFTDIDLTLWTKGQPTDISSFCENARSLKSFTMGKFYSNSYLRNLKCMFSGCVSLTDVKGFQNYSFSGARDLSYMFRDCKSLQSMTFGNDSVHGIEYITGMFDGCEKAKDINFVYQSLSHMLNYDHFDGEDVHLLDDGSLEVYYYRETQAKAPDKVYSFFDGSRRGLPSGPYTIYPAYDWVGSNYTSGTAEHDTDLPVYAHLICTRKERDDNSATTIDGYSGPLDMKTNEILTVSIRCVKETEATDEIKKTWFCPAKSTDRISGEPLTSYTKEDTNYYEIYGYKNDKISAVYRPTQDEWTQTLRCCNTMYGNPSRDTVYSAYGTVTWTNNGENPSIVVRKAPEKFLIRGFVLEPRETHTITIGDPVCNLTGDSGTTYDIDPAVYPCFPVLGPTVTYPDGEAEDHVLPALKKAGFTFLGWFDEAGERVSDNQGRFLPDDESDQVLIPRFQIRETKLILNTDDVPEGFSPARTGLRVKPEQKNLWQGGNGTYYAYITVKDGLFALPEAVYPPFSGDSERLTQSCWLEDDWYSSTRSGKALPENFLFYLGQIYPNYRAAWTTGRLTEKDRSTLQDKPRTEEAIRLIESIDPENPDEAAVKKAAEAYLSLTDEEKEQIPEEDRLYLKQAAAMLKQEEMLKAAQKQAADLEVQAAASANQATEAREEADRLQAEAEAKIAAANESVAKAEKARADAEEAVKKAETSQAAEQAAVKKQETAEKAAAEAAKKQAEAEEALKKARDAVTEAQEKQKAAEKAEAEKDAALEKLKAEMKEKDEAKTDASSSAAAEEVEALNEKNARLEEELAKANRMLQELLAESQKPANPYDTGWSFEPGTATNDNQPDSGDSYITSGNGSGPSGGSSSGAAGGASSSGATGGSSSADAAGSASGNPSSSSSSSNAGSSSTGSSDAGAGSSSAGSSSAGAGSSSAGSSGAGAGSSSGSNSGNASSGSGSSSSSSGSGSKSSSSASKSASSSSGTRSGSSSSGKKSDSSYSGSSSSYAGPSAASKNKSSSSAASSSGKKSDTDEFLLSWLNDTGSTGSSSSSAKTGTGSKASSGKNSADGSKKTAKGTEPDKAASSIGGTSSDANDSSSPLATVLAIIGIGGATAAAVAFTWRRKRPVRRKERRHGSPQ